MELFNQLQAYEPGVF